MVMVMMMMMMMMMICLLGCREIAWHDVRSYLVVRSVLNLLIITERTTLKVGALTNQSGHRCVVL